MVTKLLVVGGGKMGEALVGGVLAAGWANPAEVVVSEVSPERRDQLAAPGGLAARFPGLHVVAGQLPPAEGALVAVKPHDVPDVCRRLAEGGATRVLSIAAGVRLADLEQWCGSSAAVLRAMPNTPALVGAAATALSPGTRAGHDDVEWATAILASVGTVAPVPESQLDAVTGLSGSGPAYVFLVAEAMTEAGVLMGLPRAVAAELVVQTLLGSARLLRESGQSPEILRAAVTSPGWTTAEGLRRLEAAGTRSAFIEAVAAAAARSRELAAHSAS